MTLAQLKEFCLLIANNNLFKAVPVLNHISNDGSTQEINDVITLLKSIMWSGFFNKAMQPSTVPATKFLPAGDQLMKIPQTLFPLFEQWANFWRYDLSTNSRIEWNRDSNLLESILSSDNNVITNCYLAFYFSARDILSSFQKRNPSEFFETVLSIVRVMNASHIPALFDLSLELGVNPYESGMMGKSLLEETLEKKDFSFFSLLIQYVKWSSHPELIKIAEKTKFHQSREFIDFCKNYRTDFGNNFIYLLCLNKCHFFIDACIHPELYQYFYETRGSGFNALSYLPDALVQLVKFRYAMLASDIQEIKAMVKADPAISTAQFTKARTNLSFLLSSYKENLISKAKYDEMSNILVSEFLTKAVSPDIQAERLPKQNNLAPHVHPLSSKRNHNAMFTEVIVIDEVEDKRIARPKKFRK